MFKQIGDSLRLDSWNAAEELEAPCHYSSLGNVCLWKSLDCQVKVRTSFQLIVHFTDACLQCNE